MDKNNEFIPEISVNNTKATKVANIDGVEQEVEVPAQEGFNIKTRDLSGEYKKEFLTKELEGVILFDRYQIQSKYNVSPMYMSNEFEFVGDRNKLRVYCPEEKKVLYEGDYAGAKKHFASGTNEKTGRIEKTFDVYSILYVLIAGDVFRFRMKMNQNNNWFEYKDGCSESGDSRDDNKDYRGVVTKFALNKKKFGSNEFWTCTLQNVGKNDRKEADEVGNSLEKKLDIANDSFNDKSEDSQEEDAISVDKIPF